MSEQRGFKRKRTGNAPKTKKTAEEWPPAVWEEIKRKLELNMNSHNKPYTVETPGSAPPPKLLSAMGPGFKPCMEPAGSPKIV